jgi:hypothetical protein
MHPLSPCPATLITDDGEFLILVGRDTDSWALRIYRRGEHPGETAKEGMDHGLFVRAVPLNELWPREEFVEWEHTIRTGGESPQWFSHGHFSFSSDSRTLIYETEWITTARVDLPSGSVSKQ